MNRKAFTLIELLVVVAIIGILASVGVVAYNGYTASAKEKTTEMNFRNINKSLMIEFMKCELDSSNIVFNSHNCSSSKAPTTSLISNFINTGMNIKNPYSTKSSAISSWSNNWFFIFWGSASGKSYLLIATTLGTFAALACLIDSTVCG